MDGGVSALRPIHALEDPSRDRCPRRRLCHGPCDPLGAILEGVLRAACSSFRLVSRGMNLYRGSAFTGCGTPQDLLSDLWPRPWGG